jgi:predicted enzyme involved in methoxymalonyl-ACP biosynthesis
MSCRVIGRTVEQTLLQELCRVAAVRKLTELRGTYVPSAKNALVDDLFSQLGFEQTGEDPDGTSHWRYDLRRHGPVVNDLIDVVRSEERTHAAA